jgi:hypothetical protein
MNLAGFVEHTLRTAGYDVSYFDFRRNGEMLSSFRGSAEGDNG